MLNNIYLAEFKKDEIFNFLYYMIHIFLFLLFQVYHS